MERMIEAWHLLQNKYATQKGNWSNIYPIRWMPEDKESFRSLTFEEFKRFWDESLRKTYYRPIPKPGEDLPF